MAVATCYWTCAVFQYSFQYLILSILNPNYLVSYRNGNFWYRPSLEMTSSLVRRGLTLAFLMYEGSGPQRILNLCHAYMALGGAHGIICFGFGNYITSQTANRCNIRKPSYSKTLQVWKRLVVERFEELNVDVDINQLLIKQYAYDYHNYSKKDAFWPDPFL